MAKRNHPTKRPRRRADDTTQAPPTMAVAPFLGPEEKGTGTLLIIGGREDKDGEREILRTLAEQANGRKVVVATLATSEPEEVWHVYQEALRDVGVTKMEHLHIENRDDAFSPKVLQRLHDAGSILFTGGDQVRITSRIGGTPLCDRIRELYVSGGLIAGTSAGASAMSESMLVAGANDSSHKIGAALQMAPGLGLMQGVIIDQHFAERGRLGRLVGVVAQNPRFLGIGIDENTAIVARDGSFEVIGSGSVYVLDAIGESYTNVAEDRSDDAMSVFDLRLHIMSRGDTFDFRTRRPQRGKRDA